jgi:hypothetical protein
MTNVSDKNDGYKPFIPQFAVDLSDPVKLRRLIEQSRQVSPTPAYKPNREARRAAKRAARKHGKGFTR